MKKIIGLFYGACMGISLSVYAQSGFYIPPHIQNIQHDSAVLIWETNAEEASKVLYGPEGQELSMTATGEQNKIHRVKIEGLEPGKRYTYRIESGKDKRETTFITAPAEQSEMTFIVIARLLTGMRNCELTSGLIFGPRLLIGKWSSFALEFQKTSFCPEGAIVG